MTSKSRVHRFLAIHDISVKCSPLYRIFWEKITFNQSITFLFFVVCFCFLERKGQVPPIESWNTFFTLGCQTWLSLHVVTIMIIILFDTYVGLKKKKHLNVTFCSLRSNGNHNFFNIVKCERSSHLFALTKGFGETLIGKHGNKLKHCVVIVSLRQGRHSL